MFLSRLFLSCLFATLASAFLIPQDTFDVEIEKRLSSYHGQQVIRYYLSTVEEARAFASLIFSRRDLQLDLWTDVRLGEVDIRVGTESLFEFRNLTKYFKSEIFITDLQAEIDRERTHSEMVRLGLYETIEEEGIHIEKRALNPNAAKKNGKSKANNKNGGNAGATGAGANAAVNLKGAPSFFADYRSTADIYSFIRGLPGIKEVAVGQTYEGRNISGFVFGTGKKNVVINGGMHAREWISPAVASYITYHLTGNDTDAAQLLQQFTFTIVPVINIDGYEFTRSANGDRMWRKNRQPTTKANCRGIDPNRSFGFKWDLMAADYDACGETYHGPQAFTAPEIRTFANYVDTLSNVVSYIDLHAYSQDVLYAYGWTCTQSSPDEKPLAEGATAMVSAIQAKNGVKYISGPGCNTIYQTGGDSVDYFYSKGVTYSYCLELRDKGTYGFILPASQIVPSGEETAAGIVALYKYIATK